MGFPHWDSKRQAGLDGVRDPTDRNGWSGVGRWDTYGTVQPHTLIRQHIDYSHWYDRQKLSLKEIHNCQYVSCMNPTAGSFVIDSRLQHLIGELECAVCAETLLCVCRELPRPGCPEPHLQQHPAAAPGHRVPQVPPTGAEVLPSLIVTALALHSKVTAAFLPTAIKFHYIFNLRDLSNIFQRCCRDLVPTSVCLDVVLLPYGPAVLHPGVCEVPHRAGAALDARVPAHLPDKLVEEKDIEVFNKMQLEVVKKNFDDLEAEVLNKVPLLYAHFAGGIGEPKYLPIDSWAQLSRLLMEALHNYNELYAQMDLVLFDDAMEHICRINRILEFPRGNALLVGVGGSGKQSLSRLAAFISQLEVFQITLKKGYSLLDLKLGLWLDDMVDLQTDVSTLYLKSGMKRIGIMFLMTDAQVASESFLVLINDMLASGEVPELLPDDEVENIINGVRPEVKGAGIMDSRENCWRFFIDRVRRLLKIVLCFSPVGSTLRIRSRKFPAITNCTSIDWFHPWPHEALISQPSEESCSLFMAHAHTTVNEVSKSYLLNERRYNYTTPKSFLELIKLYRNLLSAKTKELHFSINRLDNGLTKLLQTGTQVDALKEKLALQEVELKQKNEEADNLIQFCKLCAIQPTCICATQVVGRETEKVSKEQEVAAEEEVKVGVIQAQVAVKAQECEEDLAKAEPALAAAQMALNTLNKANLTELKSFGSPPPAVTNVTAAVLVLMAPGGQVPKDRSWKAAKLLMAKVDQFLDALINFDKENIHENNLKQLQPYLVNPEFKPEFITSKSQAAAGLCSWVINIVQFYRVYCEVAPKRRALEAANAELKAATDRLNFLKEKLAVRCLKRVMKCVLYLWLQDLNRSLQELTQAYENAVRAKLICQKQAEETFATISLANRLVNGLASEKVRWGETINQYRKQMVMVPGDVLLVSAYVSYLGPFTKTYRQSLLDTHWLPFLTALKSPIPLTPNLDPLSLLTDDAKIATWNNDGLPEDRMSTENATILINSERWPLIIDPQLQGIKWIKNKFKDNLKCWCCRYLDIIEVGVSNGNTILIENIGESVDPVLDPIVGQNTSKREGKPQHPDDGRAIKMGDKEVEYHPNFRLILHTKLANPHYKQSCRPRPPSSTSQSPGTAWRTSLLAETVSRERPDLEKLKKDLTKQQNDFKIVLKELEDSLLHKLSTAKGDFLTDPALVENLENTKETAAEIEQKVAEAKKTEVQINLARELYRPAAERASLLYFILNELFKINPIYQFSLKAFSVVFNKAIDKAEKSDEIKERIAYLIDSITYSVYVYTTRGLFEVDKLIYISQMTFTILLKSKQIDPEELDFLLRYPAVPNLTSPVDFLSSLGWGGIKALANMDEFKNLDKEIEGSAKRWKKFVDSECPEKEKFPQEWKNKTSLQKLCMMRCLRPDRMTYAVMNFVEEKFGTKYVEGRSVEFAKSFEESGPATPIFFILSPGVDPLKHVEIHGRKLGFTFDKNNFHNVSLGQGQEEVAERALELASRKGHWVILQNVHLVKNWLPTLEKKLEQYSLGSHDSFRVFVSAEPAPIPAAHIIPQGILESSIRSPTSPPLACWPTCTKPSTTSARPHWRCAPRRLNSRASSSPSATSTLLWRSGASLVLRDGTRSYPFNFGDLTISVNVLYNYLEANTKVPWEDLRYLFGEIMYGGHITDDWDRRLCRTYLEEYMHPDQLDGDLYLAPGFLCPPSLDYHGYHRYVDDNLPPESPYLYGLHPNAEIGFLTNTSENLFRTLLELQPRDSGGAGGIRHVS
ncbi:DNAH9 [Cordylochernes scorpioides]|uniref:DNAH9 n=1 Tax=Cordylochernes scorpioides TaxID=51811 RepID=A0ABY6K5U8_9ARAC|nr:DNAH9 [Cordylochernes scorpioides]